MNALAGKHAFVTGASSGIGAAIALHLEKSGATVTRIARHGNESVLACDVTSPVEVAETMKRAEHRRGPIQILINNAGASASAKFEDTGTGLLDNMLDVNLKGAWHCSQRALPAMLAAGWGRIINIASLAGLQGFAYISAYSVSKHALVGLTRALATEFAGRGLAIAAVCPGYVDTGMLTAAITNITTHTGLSDEQARAKIAALNPDGRILVADEVAAAAVALCISETGAANGRIISLPPDGAQR